MEMGKVIIGQKHMIEGMLIGLLSNGHILLEGVPGLAKTLAINTLAKAMQASFSRIQFTPDLLPADLIGTMIFSPKKEEFTVKRGPIFSNFILADEINRAPAKVQSALLEAMQERQVTIGDQTYKLEEPFLVMATQNPIEQEGTYPLPEAQLDRFMFNIWVDYPAEADENVIVKATTQLARLRPRKVLGKPEILALQDIVRRVPVSDHVVKYATRLVRATRPQTPGSPKFINDWIYCGAGPRACQYLILGAKARAVLDGRANVSCNDIRSAALPVLRHRMFTNFNADSEGINTVEIIKRLLEAVPEPGERDYVPASKPKEAVRPRPEVAPMPSAAREAPLVRPLSPSDTEAPTVAVPPPSAPERRIEAAPAAAAKLDRPKAADAALAAGQWVEEEPLPEAEIVDDKAEGKPKLKPRSKLRRR